MLRTTLSKLKKACSLSIVPRVLRGDTRTPRTPVSLTILRKAKKSTKSGIDKQAECEKCRTLIELIFGPSKPTDAIQAKHKTEIPDNILHQSHDLQKHEVAQIATPIVHVNSSVITAKEDGDKPALIDETNKIPTEDAHLHATTAKQLEEQLTQKFEVNEKPYMVETEKSNIEGFNVPPRVLGNIAETNSFTDYEDQKFSNFADTKGTFSTTETFEDDYETKDSVESIVRRIEETRRLEVIRRIEEIQRAKLLLSNEFERSDFKLPIYNFASDNQNKRGASAETDQYDEIAKRCLDAPRSQIDERILKEIEKLGVPQTSPREGSVIEENIIQMDVLRKPRKPVEKTEIDLETREFERDPPIAYIDKLHPTFQRADNSRAISDNDTDISTLRTERIQLYEIDKKPLMYSEQTAAEDEMDFFEIEENMDCKPDPNYDFSQVIIDPYDKKNIAYENDENEEYDPLWYNKFSFHSEEVISEKAAETSKDEFNKTESLNEPTLYETPKTQSNENSDPCIKFDETNEKIKFSEQPQTISVSDATIANQVNESHEFSTKTGPDTPSGFDMKEQSKDAFEYITPEPSLPPETTNKRKVETIIFTQSEPETSSQEITAQQTRETQYISQFDPDSNTVNDAHDTIQNSTQPAPMTSPETCKNTSDSNPCFTQKEPQKTPEPLNAEPTPEPILKEAVPTNPKADPILPKEQISHSFMQPQTMVNPLVNSQTLTEPAEEVRNIAATCGLPKLKSDELPLSEMLKRVRMRNRMELCQAYDRQMDPVEGKCGKKTPPCPPPAPKCPPPCPPPCAPPPPPCPKPCKPACPPPCPPAKKNPCEKFKKLYSDFIFKNIITLLFQPRTFQRSPCLPMICDQFSRSPLPYEVLPKPLDVGFSLIVYPRKISVSLGSNFDAENLTLARDYEPWVPIPSWPVPTKEKKRPFVCPKEGCKLIPPPRLNPPCKENPCINFPKRCNSFSITNCIFPLSEYLLFDFRDT